MGKGKFWKTETAFLIGDPGTLKAVFLKIVICTNPSVVPKHPDSGPLKMGPGNLHFHKPPRWFLSPLKA